MIPQQLSLFLLIIKKTSLFICIFDIFFVTLQSQKVHHAKLLGLWKTIQMRDDETSELFINRLLCVIEITESARQDILNCSG